MQYQGWAPNQASYSFSKSLTSGWSPRKDIGNGIASDTQATSILTIRGTDATSFLYMGDRRQDPDLPHSKTIIFPISFSGTDNNFGYKPIFDIDYSSGLTRDISPSRHISKADWKVIDFSSGELNNENGRASNGLIREYIFQISTDGKNWHTPSTGPWLPYHSEVIFPTSLTARYFKIISPKGDCATIAEIEVLGRRAKK